LERLLSFASDSGTLIPKSLKCSNHCRWP